MPDQPCLPKLKFEKIKTQAEDKVHVILFADNDPLEIPEELLVCLQDEPAAYSFFQSFTESEQEK